MTRLQTRRDYTAPRGRFKYRSTDRYKTQLAYMHDHVQAFLRDQAQGRGKEYVYYFALWAWKVLQREQGAEYYLRRLASAHERHACPRCGQKLVYPVYASEVDYEKRDDLEDKCP